MTSYKKNNLCFSLWLCIFIHIFCHLRIIYTRHARDNNKWQWKWQATSWNIILMPFQQKSTMSTASEDTIVKEILKAIPHNSTSVSIVLCDSHVNRQHRSRDEDKKNLIFMKISDCVYHLSSLSQSHAGIVAILTVEKAFVAKNPFFLFV